jgi:hypothetical protein
MLYDSAVGRSRRTFPGVSGQRTADAVGNRISTYWQKAASQTRSGNYPWWLSVVANKYDRQAIIPPVSQCLVAIETTDF